MKISMEELLCEEPITKDQFKKIARFLDMTYPAKTKNDIPFLAEKETFEVWYELLKDNLYLPMCLGMKEYCLENKYPPAVSDIAEYTHRFTVRVRELKRIIENDIDFIKCVSNVEISKDEYIDFILEDEKANIEEYIHKSNKFREMSSRTMFNSLQELIGLWKDYWKKPKNP